MVAVGTVTAAVLLVLHRSSLSAAMAAPIHGIAAVAGIQPQAIIEALGFTVLAALLNGMIWSRLLSRLGYDLGGTVGLRTFLSADLAGYVANVPGSAVGCAVSLRRHGVCPGRAALLSLIANLLGLCSILVWVPVGILLLSRAGMAQALPILGHDTPFAAVCLLVVATIGSVVALQALATAGSLGNGLARRLLRRAPTISPSATPIRLHHLLALIPWSAISWLAGALALYPVLGALAPDTSINLGDLVGSAALAAMLGSLAFFVPSGMGVRDGALIALLTHSTGLPLATCTEAAIVIRALDPATKVAMLFLLATGLPDRARAMVTTGRRAAGRCVLALARPRPTPSPLPALMLAPDPE
ncbi:MAG TPA: lysylphosphatidylglycerol synthase domain-containing protein [Chloroflexota bacterium]|nr:lysylphosphatidylglycerol synthase domain-containing protein [Chloroflexota bacterium]